MRAALFLSVTYAVDGFSEVKRSQTALFYFLMFIIFLVMDIAELTKG